jgi:RNA polymerase sigma-70 factor (ECF subfamily)
VLLTVHRVRHTYDPRRPFSPWLAAIASRRTVDAIRRGGRIAAHETADETAYETFSDDAANQSTEDGGVGEAQLQAWLAELPPGQRQALELLKLREMSLAEAAAVSGQSVGALKVGVHRAIKTLRAKLKIQSA